MSLVMMKCCKLRRGENVSFYGLLNLRYFRRKWGTELMFNVLPPGGLACGLRTLRPLYGGIALMHHVSIKDERNLHRLRGVHFVYELVDLCRVIPTLVRYCASSMGKRTHHGCRELSVPL